MLEARSPAILAGESERVDIVFTNVLPVFERDAQLERALDGFHEILLLDLEQLVQRRYRRNGRFTHTNGADLLRLDQGNVEVST